VRGRYLSCEWFVNAVEWLGARLNVGPLAVGTVLAAFGTALPASVVTFVAVVFGTTTPRRTSASAPRWADRWCWPRSRTA
jgi:Ca2+/Na+ antiporter